MFAEEYTPRRRGFDTHYGYYQGAEGYFDHTYEANEVNHFDLYVHITTILKCLTCCNVRLLDCFIIFVKGTQLSLPNLSDTAITLVSSI